MGVPSIMLVCCTPIVSELTFASAVAVCLYLVWATEGRKRTGRKRRRGGGVRIALDIRQGYRGDSSTSNGAAMRTAARPDSTRMQNGSLSYGYFKIYIFFFMARVSRRKYPF